MTNNNGTNKTETTLKVDDNLTIKNAANKRGKTVFNICQKATKSFLIM